MLLVDVFGEKTCFLCFSMKLLNFNKICDFVLIRISFPCFFYRFFGPPRWDIPPAPGHAPPGVWEGLEYRHTCWLEDLGTVPALPHDETRWRWWQRESSYLSELNYDDDDSQSAEDKLILELFWSCHPLLYVWAKVLHAKWPCQPWVGKWEEWEHVTYRLRVGYIHVRIHL